MKTTSLLIIHTAGFRRRLIYAAACAAVLATFAVVSSAQAENRAVVISFDENFTGNNTIDGTFTVGGVFSDKGTRHEDFTVTVVGNQAIVTGTLSCVGALGTLREQFFGTIDDVTQTKTYMTGTGTFTGGTGVYSGLAGNATFTLTIDFQSGNLVGVTTGRVRKTDTIREGAPEVAPETK